MFFPYIKTIDDVLPAIKGKDEFKVSEKEDYIVINYVYRTEDTFKDPNEKDIGDKENLFRKLRLECRGITFDKQGKIIRRPFHKFFNLNENSFSTPDNFEFSKETVVLEKRDGSMIAPIRINGAFRLGTKSGITDISMQAEEFIADKSGYLTFIQHELDHGFTPIFEWTSRKNRIVIDYPEDNLTLLAVRDNYTGEYLSYKWMNDFISLNDEMLGVPIVKNYTFSDDLIKISNNVSNWKESEGVVIYFSTGNLLKIKADEYVNLHKIRSLFNNEKYIIEVILDDNVDDVLPLLPEIEIKKLTKFVCLFWVNVNNVCFKLKKLYQESKNIEDQKTYATEFVMKQEKKYQPILFAMRKGVEPFDFIKDTLRKSLSNSARLEECRWMFGDIRWDG